MVLDPGKRLSITDVADPRIREGLQITKRALAEIATYSAENGIDLHVALMPVRELVFHDLVGDLKAEDAERMDQLRQNLEIIEADLGAYLDGAGISWTNLRPVMETALATRNIYPPTDGHPNAIGYGIVAEAIARDSGF